VLTALYVSGWASGAAGRWPAAETAFEEAARIGAGISGPPMRLLPLVLLGLGEAQSNQLKLAAAEQSFRRGLDLLRKAKGAENPELARQLANFAEFLAGGTNPGEAVRVARDAAAVVARRFPDGDGFYTPYVLGPLAVSLLAYGRPDLAQDVATKALAASERFRPSTPYSSMLRVYRAEALVQRGHIDEAEREIEQAERIRIATGAIATEPPIVSLHAQKALLLAVNGRPAEARAAIADVLAQDVIHAERAAAIELLLVTAEAAQRSGDSATAMDLAQKATALIDRLGIGKYARLDSATAHYLEGEALLAGGTAPDARRRLTQALAVRTELLDPASPKVAQVQVALARVLAADSQYDEARKLVASAKAIYAQHAELAEYHRSALRAAEASLRH
jgi:tetratricopeptide (TPR) repeat protein